MSKFNPTIKHAKNKRGTSTNSNKHPYLRDRISIPTCELHNKINHCNDVFDGIALKRKNIGKLKPITL